MASIFFFGSACREVPASCGCVGGWLQARAPQKRKKKARPSQWPRKPKRPTIHLALPNCKTIMSRPNKMFQICGRCEEVSVTGWRCANAAEGVGPCASPESPLRHVQNLLQCGTHRSDGCHWVDRRAKEKAQHGNDDKGAAHDKGEGLLQRAQTCRDQRASVSKQLRRRQVWWRVAGPNIGPRRQVTAAHLRWCSTAWPPTIRIPSWLRCLLSQFAPAV